ncbi:hypothetical protein [Roseibium sp. RKSG952]|uniref:hypothetical protein n=1 Tax=Roseibium sp. RKSG952 TaxID=2529384 RepID=UPI0012BD4B3B|nr:hypothetical protein [Roseibium sp. RKSG952]MTH95309.1 hypothetical protein [Roseibium sp. RKSG952]
MASKVLKIMKGYFSPPGPVTKIKNQDAARFSDSEIDLIKQKMTAANEAAAMTWREEGLSINPRILAARKNGAHFNHLH